jgi:hypothetical protein
MAIAGAASRLIARRQTFGTLRPAAQTRSVWHNTISRWLPEIRPLMPMVSPCYEGLSAAGLLFQPDYERAMNSSACAALAVSFGVPFDEIR